MALSRPRVREGYSHAYLIADCHASIFEKSLELSLSADSTHCSTQGVRPTDGTTAKHGRVSSTQTGPRAALHRQPATPAFDT